MPTTYKAISTVTVGSTSVASIDFTSIPATYTDLKVVYSLRTTLSGGPYYFDDLALRVNGDTGSNYSRLSLRTRDGTISSVKTSPTSFMDIYSANAANASTSAFATGEFYIPNYAGSTYKSLSSDGHSETYSPSDGVYGGFTAGIWNSTSAITSLKIYSQNSTNFVQYSTATLYGIKNS